MLGLGALGAVGPYYNGTYYNRTYHNKHFQADEGSGNAAETLYN